MLIEISEDKTICLVILPSLEVIIQLVNKFKQYFNLYINKETKIYLESYFIETSNLMLNYPSIYIDTDIYLYKNPEAISEVRYLFKECNTRNRVYIKRKDKEFYIFIKKKNISINSLEELFTSLCKRQVAKLSYRNMP